MRKVAKTNVKEKITPTRLRGTCPRIRDSRPQERAPWHRYPI